MTISAYLASAKERLLTELIVTRFVVLRERTTAADGHWRVRVSLADGSTLEFSEYVRISGNQVIAITYSYHWADADATLICRWDNTPHYPDLPGFPYHIHDGSDEKVRPGQSMDLFAVLDEIVRRLSSSLQEN